MSIAKWQKVVELEEESTTVASSAKGKEGPWSKLPEDVMEKVFASLPLHTLLRVRAVCLRWKRVISSSAFTKLYAQVSPKSHWFLMFPQGKHRGRVAAYDSTLSKWHELPFKFLPVEFECVASAGGLLCCRSTQSRVYLFVCNPMTRTFRKLPRKLQHHQDPAIGMVIDRDTGGYKVIVALAVVRRASNIGSVEIYDSTSKLWVLKDPIPSDYCVRMVTHPHPTFHKGSLHYGLSIEGGFISYDIEREVWSKVQGSPLIRPSYLAPHLFVSQGRLFCVILTGENIRGLVVRSVKIFELHQTSPVLLEVTRIPPAFGEYPRSITVAGHINSNVICVSSQNCPRILLYNMSEDSWVRVANFPDRSNHLPRVGPESAFAFEPRLDRLV